MKKIIKTLIITSLLLNVFSPLATFANDSMIPNTVDEQTTNELPLGEPTVDATIGEETQMDTLESETVNNDSKEQVEEPSSSANNSNLVENGMDTTQPETDQNLTQESEQREIQTMQPVYSFDYIDIDKTGILDFYGWMISKNMNITSPTDMRIDFVLTINGEDKIYSTATRWQRDDITPIYGVSKYEYPWAGMRLKVDLSQLPVGTYDYHLRLSQPGYKNFGQVIPKKIMQEINGNLITIDGSRIIVEPIPEKTMQPVYSFDYIDIDKTGILDFYGWMISKNMNITSPTDMRIDFVLTINGEDKIYSTATRWQRDDITPIYGVSKYEYPWAGMRLKVDLSQLPVGTYDYHLRLSQPGYKNFGQVIPKKIMQEINGNLITIDGSRIIVEPIPEKTMQPVYSFDYIDIDKTGILDFYGWMISKNMNITSPTDMRIDFVLTINGEDKIYSTATRWQRDDITPIYGVSKYEYPWAGMRLKVDLSQLPVGTYDYHLRLSQPGYKNFGQVIPKIASQIVGNKKITISGSTIKVTEHGEAMQPVMSIDSIKLTESGLLELSGWMISKNVNILTPNDLPITAYINDKVVAIAHRWERHDITPIYGDGKYQYPWAGFKIAIDVSQLTNAEHTYELRLNQPGYEQTAVYLPNLTVTQNTQYKLIFNDGKMIKTPYVNNQGIVLNSIEDLYIHGEKLNVRGYAKLGSTGSSVGTKQLVALATNGKEYIRTVNDNLGVQYANAGFDLQQLPAGYYQLAIKLQNQRDLAISNKNLNIEFFTVRRQGKFKKINISAKANQPIVLVVTDLNATDSRYAHIADVTLDPGHGGSYGTSLGDSGACSAWVGCEASEMLDLSKRIQSRLGQHGLKVSLTREQSYMNGELPQYGPNSRTEKVYKSQGKLVISNHYNSSTSSSPRGFMILHSKENNNILADKITRNLNTMAQAVGDSGMGTVCDRKTITGYHTLNGYDISGTLANRDCYFAIREYGGKVTKGVQYNYGSQTISPEPLLAEYFFGSNYTDVTHYKNKKTQYVESVVKAIVEYYGIPYRATRELIEEEIIFENSLQNQTPQDKFNNMKY